jgi:hypothetical protein
MVTIRPKLARSSTKALVVDNSSECTDGAFCILVSVDVLGQTSGSSLCMCVCVVEVFELCGRLPDVASVSEMHISKSEAAADKFHSQWCTYEPPTDLAVRWFPWVCPPPTP